MWLKMGFFKKTKPERYITLKEAAVITGYSSDYVGQLIRSGKVGGKQVYTNPVWMTTVEEVERYLSEIKKVPKRDRDRKTPANLLRRLKTRFRSELEIVKIYRKILYLTMGVSIALSLFLFYIFSVSLDNRLTSGGESGFEAGVTETVPENQSVIEF